MRHWRSLPREDEEEEHLPPKIFFQATEEKNRGKPSNAVILWPAHPLRSRRAPFRTAFRREMPSTKKLSFPSLLLRPSTKMHSSIFHFILVLRSFFPHLRFCPRSLPFLARFQLLRHIAPLRNETQREREEENVFSSSLFSLYQPPFPSSLAGTGAKRHRSQTGPPRHHTFPPPSHRFIGGRTVRILAGTVREKGMPSKEAARVCERLTAPGKREKGKA